MFFSDTFNSFSNTKYCLININWQLSVVNYHIITKPSNSYAENFLSILLVICLTTYAIINVFYFRRLKQILKSFFSQRFINQLVRDGELLNENISLILYVNYFISFSILLYIADKYFTQNYQLSNIYYLQILVFIILLFFIKIGFIRILGIIFKTKRETREYLRLQYVFNQATGLFLLPLLILIIYLKINLLLIFSFILLFLILVFRLMRVIIYRISPSNFSEFYLFLYLCTIEILPLLIFFKLIYSYLIPFEGINFSIFS